jgi:hypothetical protein
MSEDAKAPTTTVRVPGPRPVSEGVARSPDARTAEVLRALDRAKGTIGGSEVPTDCSSTGALFWELRALVASLARTTPVVEDAAKRLASCAGQLERAMVVPREKLAEFQRTQNGAYRELRESAQALERQADVLATWRTWWTRLVVAWTLFLMSLFGAALGLAWRAHTLAQSTHDILEQILENQTKAHAAPAGKRR